MVRSAGPRLAPSSAPPVPLGAVVPRELRATRAPIVLSPAAARAVRHRMLLLRQDALDRIAALTGVPTPELRRRHHELSGGDLPEALLQRGALQPFLRELPQGALLYLLVRGLRPSRVIETGVRPGYSTAWILAGLRDNGAGELLSLGPGPHVGRARGLSELPVGSLVPPSLRSRWTLVLGNTEERLGELLNAAPLDLFFYDNGPDPARARFELREAWAALSPDGVLLAHHVDANPAWAEFCRAQGLSPQRLDDGPPPMGALAMRSR
jgi:predicted O-methyltransferase YrrM